MGAGRWLLAGAAAAYAVADYAQRNSRGQGSGQITSPPPYYETPKKKSTNIWVPSPDTSKELYDNVVLRGNNDIRLLTVKPGDFNDPIVLSMTAGNSKTARYEALSYTWGSSEKPNKVDISTSMGRGVKGQVDITDSLDIALRYLRNQRGGEARTLWVDALCINQKSDTELNHMVPIMGQIYSRAERVVVWLGEADDESARAMKYFNELKEETPMLSMAALEKSFTEDLAKWYDFGDGLLTRQWWGRAWIVQEYVMSRDLIFVCGSDSMSEELFFTITMFAVYRHLDIFRSDPMDARESRNRQAPQALAAAKRGRQTGELKNDLCAWITNFHPWECQHPLDRIYAFMGMVDNCTIIPKYHLKIIWPALYAEAAVEIMRQRNNLDFMCLGHGPERHEEMASWGWVPDLQMHPVETACLPPLGFTTYSRYNASNGTGFSAEMDRKKLKVEGIYFARIKDMTIEHTLEETGIPESKRLAYGPGGRLRTRPYPHKREHTCEVAMVRTLCWDLNWDRKRCSSGETFVEREPYTPIPADFRPEVGSQFHRRNLFEAEMSRAASMHRNMRRFAIVGDGYFAMVPEYAQINDWVCVLKGATAPMVLRQVGSGTDYKFIGECYVHGIMDGEFWRQHTGPRATFYLC